MDRLKGKIAMVVGAGSIGPGWGNGKATAVTFAREGAQVFCVDRKTAAAEETVNIIKGEGGNAVAFTADVSRAEEVEAMVAACMKAYGRIDVLDNNVGIAEMGSVVEVTETEWDRVFAVNLKSAYLSMKHVIPIMVKQGGGSIINISSIASIRHVGIWRCRRDVARPRRPGSDGPHGRSLGRRQRGAVPGLRRVALHHRHRARGRWRADLPGVIN